MPRRPRIHLDGQPLHIVQRGHNRGRCFFTDGDYRIYLRWLAEALHEADCRLHAYTLMTNHVHLLLTPEKAAAVPRFVISLGRRYVQYVNTTYRRTGTLWDSRYKSSLIQTETYLLWCMRYIELNPVRAGMVESPARYPWSSYGHNGLARPDPLVVPHPLYLALGTDAYERSIAYRTIFGSEVDTAAMDDIRRALAQGQPLGDERFAGLICAMTGVQRTHPRRGRPTKSKDGFGGGQGELGL
ncbi:MAG: transposase [Rhodocyclales bacterium]|nr:transposase [Rhodocyclales bacterium]